MWLRNLSFVNCVRFLIDRNNHQYGHESISRKKVFQDDKSDFLHHQHSNGKFSTDRRILRFNLLFIYSASASSSPKNPEKLIILMNVLSAANPHVSTASNLISSNKVSIGKGFLSFCSLEQFSSSVTILIIGKYKNCL